MLQTLTYKIGIAPGGLPTRVMLSQNENGRQLQFDLRGTQVNIPAGSVATISGTKPDGVVYSAEGTLSGTVATFAEDTQMTAVAGEWEAKIRVTYGGQVIASERVWMIIDRDPVEAGSVPSESELNGLVAEAQQYAENARSAAYGSPLTAATAAAMVDVTKVYVYTGSESGMVAGHWYYYDGSAWQDGGVYQSQGTTTDTTLSVLGMPADAKATGDALATKVPAEPGKGLSTNDFTTEEKQKLAGIAAEATKTIIDATLTQAGQAADAKKTGDEITDVKNAFDKITYSDNLVNPDSVTDGKYVNYSTGNLVSAENLSVTDYIYVDADEVYTQTSGFSGCQVAFYDSSKSYLSGILLNNTKTFSTPNSCRYLRISLETANKNTYALCKGTAAVYSPYALKPIIGDNSVGTNAIINDSVTFDKIAFKEKVIGDNLFDKNNVVVGYVQYNNGRIAASATNYRASDYIAIEPETVYTVAPFASGIQTAFYDEDKTYISGILHTSSNLTFETPSNAKYLRTTTGLDKLDTFAMCKGASASYTPYVEKTVIPEQYLPDPSDAFYIVVAKDGSGDYTTLTEAVLHASDGDVIFVKAGVYDEEEVEAWGKDITIIGEDMLSTIVQNGLNTYSRPPIEMSGGRISNLTVYAYDGGGESLDANGWLPYAIHIDNIAQFENTLHIDNCILKSDRGRAIGIGLRKGELRFDNCKFVSRDSNPFYFHDATNPTYGGNQYLTLKNCVGIAKSSAKVMVINSQKTEGAVVYPEFIDCIFVSDISDAPAIEAVNVNNSGGTATEVGTFMNLINFYQVKTSRNNYPESLNYQYP